MISSTQSVFAADIRFETADAGVQGFAYPQEAPLAAGSAIKPTHDQSAIANVGLFSSGADVAVMLILLAVMVYGVARWLRRRTLARTDDDFLPDRKLDPEKIRVSRIYEKP